MENKNKFLIDYQSFLTATPENVPSTVQNELFNKISKDLSPAILNVSIKFGVLQAVGIFLSLLVCPQFGFGPFGGTKGLMSVYMLAGSYACAIFCGATFLCFSSLLSSLILTIDENRKVFSTKLFLAPFILSVIFASAMVIKGEETFTYASLWIFGSGISYFIFMKTGQWVKIKVQAFVTSI